MLLGRKYGKNSPDLKAKFDSRKKGEKPRRTPQCWDGVSSYGLKHPGLREGRSSNLTRELVSGDQGQSKMDSDLE